MKFNLSIMQNPFIISTYKSPEYFCDREKELEQLNSALNNGRNIVLLSLRRMGKTGLIKHLFNKLEDDKNVFTFYFDIMNTNSIEDFANMLANSILGTFNSKSKKLFDKTFKYFSKFSPIVSFDENGYPTMSLKSNNIEQSKVSITSIFNYLENQNQKIFIAIDEFQQITKYSDKSFEAFLRSNIQHLNNVNFIFSGSQQHILKKMFSSYSEPFYQSSDFLKLERINKDIYAEFIVNKFSETKKQIKKEEVEGILLWLDSYTFYIQNFFNKLWYISDKIVDDNLILKTKQYILDEHNFIYSNLHNMLTKMQYKLLKVIAKENGVKHPTSNGFINKHNLGTTSTISSAIKALVDNEMIYYENNTYKVYDVFLSKWLEKN